MDISLSIKNVRTEKVKGEYTLKGDVDDGDRSSEVYFTSQEVTSLPQKIGDTFLCSMLMPAMKMGGRLIIDAPVSRSLHHVVSTTIQDIYLCWDRSLKRVEIEAAIEDDSTILLSEQASFFSGGLDSLYTLNKHKEDITHTVFVWGFDISLEDEKLWNESRDYLNTAAERYNKTPIYVKTNLKSWAGRRVEWGMYHGGALTAIGHFLSGCAGQFYIGSTHSYRDLFPWGSHPVLDHLWATETTKFVHDGCEATRIQKAAAIANDQIALDILRVCYKNPKGAYNCGKCDKCLRTMMNLQAVGALNKCKTLPHQLDYSMIANAEILDNNTLSFYEENRDAAQKTGQTQLVSALNQAISRKGRYHFKTLLRKFVIQSLWSNTPKVAKNTIRFLAGRPLD